MQPGTQAFKKCIPIDATAVGALLGLNKYKTNLYQLVMKYWERGFPIVETISTNEVNEPLWSPLVAAQGLGASARALHL